MPAVRSVVKWLAIGLGGLIALLALLVAALTAFAVWQAQQARPDARAFCAAIQPGAALPPLLDEARQLGATVRSTPAADGREAVHIVFHRPPAGRAACLLSAKDGQVSADGTTFIDD